MPIAYLTRAVHFSASHRYYRPEWTEAENLRRFGPSALPEGHGHNYRCEVTVFGPIDPETGMVVDLAELDAILKVEVVDRLHFRSINSVVPEFAPGAGIPTTEGLAAYILHRISGRLLGRSVRVHRVRVREDRDLWSDVYASAPQLGTSNPSPTPP